MNSYIILRPQGPDGVLAETTVFRELGQIKTKENNPSYNCAKEIIQKRSAQMRLHSIKILSFKECDFDLVPAWDF